MLIFGQQNSAQYLNFSQIISIINLISLQSQFKQYQIYNLIASKMIPTSSFSSRNHSLNQENNRHFQQEQSPLQAKLHSYQVQIRVNQISKFKDQKRQELLTIKTIEDLIEQLPFNNQSTQQWAPQLMTIYGGAQYYQLRADKVVELFRVVEKFPNKLTLQLLQVIVLRSNINTLDQLFQYDVMKLLHSVINYTDKFTKKRPVLCEESASILKEAVINSDTVQNIATNVQREGCCDLQQNIELVKIDLRIIAELCRKSPHIRNFAILNHKSYTYCFKAYKRFGQEVRTEFMGFLEAATANPFLRYEQQFQRIINKITYEFYSCSFICQSDNNKSLQDKEWLLMAFNNLVKMKCAWTNTKIQLHGSNLLSQKIVTIINNYMMAFTRGDVEESQSGKILIEVINLTMNYMETFQPQEDVAKIESLYLDLAYSSLSQARKGIYFLLSNLFCDNNITPNFLCKLIFLGDSNQGLNLIGLLTNLLINETDSGNHYQMAYLFYSIFEHIPFQLYQIIEPLVLHSDLLQTVTSKILQRLSWGRADDMWEECANNILTDSLILFLTKIGPSFAGMQHVQQMIYSQFGEKLSAVINRGFCQQKLAKKLQDLLNILRLGSIPFSL